jgi:hypothetical protein
MHTETTQKEKPTGDGNPTAGHTDGASVTQYGDDQKRFATLAAQYALAGHALTRSSPADGAQTFYTSRWGHIKPLASLDAAARFLVEIGGVQ